MRSSTQSGVSLVEVVVGVTMVSMILVVIGYSIQTYMTARTALLTNVEAAYLAEEGYEILRHLRNEDWDAVTAVPTDTLRYLAVSTTTLAISTTPEIIDTEYRRSFKLQSVYRNGSDDIVDASAPGATLDTNARRVEMSVASPQGTTTYEAILTNLYEL